MLNICYLRTSELTKKRFIYALLINKAGEAGVHIFLTNPPPPPERKYFFARKNRVGTMVYLGGRG